jgi:hypothetical protein
MKEKKCLKCNDPKNLLSWWFFAGMYGFICMVKVTVDIIKYIIELF